LIFQSSISHVTRCAGCDINEAWETLGHPCLACQIATVIYRNPFHKRLEIQIQQWLSQENSDSDSCVSTLQTPSPIQLPKTPQMLCTEQDLLQQRSASIERCFQEIRQKASPQERQFIFENLTILKNDIQSQQSTQLKRDFDSQEDTSIESRIADENLSPAKKGSFSRNLFPDESLQLEKISRPPLFL